MTYDAQVLLKLLPELYESSDGENGPLRALLDVLADEAERVDENIRQLYDDLFIETCDEWAVPYIGDLLGVRGLHRVEAATFSQRGWVANAIALRRRKGTLSSIRQIAQDVTGYRAAAVEMFQLLEWTQNDDHLRFQNPRTPDLRNSNPLELIETAFNRASLSGDVRSIERRRGKANIKNIAITLFRLGDYPVTGVLAKKFKSGAHWFSPLGLDIPLFNSPEPEPGLVSGPATEPGVPVVLRRRAVHDDLEAMRAAQVLGTGHASPYFDTDPPIFKIVVDGAPVPTAEIFVCNLETWGNVPTARTYPDADGNSQNLPIRVGVDTLGGRLKFVKGQEPKKAVYVDYGYGFGSAMGGGPYDRTRDLPDLLPATPTWYRCVTTAPAGAAPFVVNTLDKAIADWNTEGAGKRGLIVVLDSDSYACATTAEIAEDSHLLILASAWPTPTLVTDPRDVKQLSPNGVRPHVKGDITVHGVPGANPDKAGSFALSGFLVEGGLTVLPGNLATLQVADATFVPGNGTTIQTSAAGPNLRLEASFDRCILGAITVQAPAKSFALADCIVQGDVQGTDLPLSVDRSTILGATNCERVDASDSIFSLPLIARRTQVGCVRFSFVPSGSRAPRVYRCQPDLAIEQHIDPLPLTPSFASTTYGDPSYGLLSDATADEILSGASNGDEMGAFNRELHTLREANLRFALSDTLRVGLEAGIFHGN